MMRQFMGMMPRGFETEVIYSFVIIVCSLMIYFGTKELYELSSHKGIKYLRESFLFFAVAYFFRSFIKIFFILSSPPRMMSVSSAMFQDIGLFIFIYFSSMAAFYLVYSIMWKRWGGKSNKIYIFHGIALIISLISILFNNSLVYLVINLIILAFILAVTLISYSDHKIKRKGKDKRNNLYVIYGLLFIFWILNILDILIPNFFSGFQMIIYLASVGIFLGILYKVLKRSGSN